MFIKKLFLNHLALFFYSAVFCSGLRVKHNAVICFLINKKENIVINETQLLTDAVNRLAKMFDANQKNFTFAQKVTVELEGINKNLEQINKNLIALLKQPKS